MNYSGNKIYEYINENGLHDYFYLAGSHWMLIYGNKDGIPKVFAYVNMVDTLDSRPSADEKSIMRTCSNIAEQLSLPFIWIRYANNSNIVQFYHDEENRIFNLSYDQLRECFESYGVVESGTPKKAVNQYTSSRYHDWQRSNLGRITVTDIDLVKFSGSQIESIIELKRSKYPLDRWTPYSNDYPNFALTINTIVLSGKRIPFYLFYNVLRDGIAGRRIEDLSSIKFFEFVIPNCVIDCSDVQYNYKGITTLTQLL
jgi:hypothetical protein